MKNKILFCLLLCSHLAWAQGFLKTDGPSIVTSSGEKIILRGMGLGGWMLQEGYMLRVQGIAQQQHVIRDSIESLIGTKRTNEFYSKWLENHTRKIDIDSMAAWGFNSIRLPIHYNLFTLPVDQEPVKGENTWLEKGFIITDNLLKWCAANKIYLILDLHAAPGGQGNDLNISDRDPSKPSLWQDELSQKKTIALWRKLAERYAQEPWIGAYDIINEPNWGFEKTEDKNGCNESLNAPLKKLMMDITTAIREVDKNHIIIIEGNCWGNNYNGVFPPWDKNTVISFHKYWNYNDQGSIQKFVDIRKQYNTPVWLGESGENSNLWFRDAINLVEKNEIGWAWWPLKKLGHNNPLQIKMPGNYQKVIDYWAGKSPKPSSDDAYQGLMEFVENLKLENCIYHPDVVDAMFRQPHSNETIPFNTHEIKSGFVMQAVEYDMGRNGFAYADKDTANYWVAGGETSGGNKDHVYRNDGVDISEVNKKFVIDNIESGEWLQYTVESKASKNYAISVVVMAQASGKLSFEVNGKATEVLVPSTNHQWQPVKVGSVALKKGKNILRLKSLTGGYQLQSIQFK